MVALIFVLRKMLELVFCFFCSQTPILGRPCYGYRSRSWLNLLHLARFVVLFRAQRLVPGKVEAVLAFPWQPGCGHHPQ